MNRRVWIAGLTVGAAGGFAALEVPTVGWLVLVGFALGALRGPRRAAAIGGELLALGAAWTALLGRVGLTCRSGCQAPGLDAWLAAGVAFLLAGLALSTIAMFSARAVRRSR